MAKKVAVATKTERLRALRLAHEAARKQAGTWGDMMVGEIVHEATRSVFVQVWKGPSRPDPFRQGAVRQAGIGPAEWSAITAWVNSRHADGFSKCVLARDMTKEEAQRVAEARIAQHVNKGYTVMNPAESRQ